MEPLRKEPMGSPQTKEMKPTVIRTAPAGSNTGFTTRELPRPEGDGTPTVYVPPEPGSPHNDDREGPPDTFLSVDEAAALLRVNRKTAYQAVAERRMPGVIRLGRIIRIRRDALLQWGR